MKKIYLLFLLFCMSLFTVGQTDATLLKESNLLKSGFVKLSTIPIDRNSIIVLDDEVIYNYSGKIDTFTVPSNVDKIKITVIGAAGGIDASSAFPGGLGALVSGEFDVVPGDSLKLLVEEKPSRNGGGGGSFVSDLLNNPIIIAGGGGGSGVEDSPEKHGSVTETGGKGGGTGGDGGIDGNGGLANGSGFQSGAGGGFLTNGQNGNMTGGIAFVIGGNHLISGGYGDGGFGGGGTGSGYVVGGGGGGYSGGGAAGAGVSGGVGGAGASYNSGINKNFIAQHNSGHGQIIIELMRSNPCPEDIIVENDSASCSAVVTYTITIPEKGSVVQTSGLSSGSEFPVGTTTNCFKLIDSLDVETTCCFTVTINDTEAPVAVCKAGGNSNILLLWDEDNANTQSLKAAIEAEGFIVTMPAVPEYQWDNTNPPLDDFDAVVHLKGTTWTSPMSLSAQNALVDFVTIQGKAFIHSEWDAYEIDDTHQQDAMSEITILQRYTGNTSDLTYTVVSGMESHPVLNDIPTSFTISYVGFSPSNLRSYVSNPAEMLMTDQNGTAAVAVRDFGKGKVVGFNHAGNYAGSTALSNALVQQLYINALNWAATGVFQLDNGGTVTITPEEIDGGSYDDCSGIASMELDKTTFTTDDIGEQEVTLTVTDEGGNTSSCTSTITITSSDNEVPQVVANTIEVYLDETGRYVLDKDDVKAIAVGTTDNLTPFEDLKLVAYPKIFVCANVGEVIHLRLTVEDADGNKAKQWTTVTVLDTISPVALCKDIDIYLNENGQAMITPEQLKDSATYDACGVESVALDKFIFNCTDLGENAVTLTVTDLSGNVATCTAMVMVYDTLPPTSVTVADVELEVEPGICETAVEYPEALFTENCGVVLEQTSGLGPDGIFPIGTTTETWLATDDAGNTAEISFNVIVTTSNSMPTLDTVANVIAGEDTPPITVELTGISYGIDCAEQVVTLAALANNTVLVSSVVVEYTDGEPTGSVKLTLTPDVSGTSEINVTVKDSEGAMVSKTFTVTINPVNDAPFMVHSVPDQVVNASYVLKIPLSPALGIVFDDVDDAVLAFGIMEEGGGALPGWATIVGDTLFCTPMIADTGCVNLVLKATDADGASASDTFIICVDGYPVSSPLVNESAFEVKLYPNPTNDRVNIEINNAFGITDVSVYSITGKEILRKNFYNKKIISFSMNEYVSGMYLVKMNIEGKQIVKKLVLDKK